MDHALFHLILIELPCSRTQILLFSVYVAPHLVSQCDLCLQPFDLLLVSGHICLLGHKLLFPSALGQILYTTGQSHPVSLNLLQLCLGLCPEHGGPSYLVRFFLIRIEGYTPFTDLLCACYTLLVVRLEHHTAHVRISIRTAPAPAELFFFGLPLLFPLLRLSGESIAELTVYGCQCRQCIASRDVLSYTVSLLLREDIAFEEVGILLPDVLEIVDQDYDGIEFLVILLQIVVGQHLIGDLYGSDLLAYATEHPVPALYITRHVVLYIALILEKCISALFSGHPLQVILHWS